MRSSSASIHWITALLSAFFITGLFIDGWAHTHGQVDDTFFTPWHAIFYSAFGLVALYLSYVGIRNKKSGGNWRDAFPVGYEWSMIGVIIFGGGGLFDLVWHELFGVEANVEALLSPSHLILAVGLFLIVSGPFRSAMHEKEPASGLLSQIPSLLSLSFSLSVLTFITQFTHQISHLWGVGALPENQELVEKLGAAGWMLTTAITIGVLLFALKERRLPVGGVTIIMTINSIAMGFLYGAGPYPITFVIAGIISAIIVDLLHAKLPTTNTFHFRLFSVLAPALFALGYFITALMTDGIWWSVHFWTGTVAISGIIGLLMSYAVRDTIVVSGQK